MGACKDCKYFKRINDNPESYGNCRWFDLNPVPMLPKWSDTIIQYGLIHPSTIGCRTFEPKDE